MSDDGAAPAAGTPDAVGAGRRPAAWLWAAIVIGVTVRLGLAWFSAGTTDVSLWLRHAEGVAREGVTLHYLHSLPFNHPPPIAWLAARLWEWTHGSRWAFAGLFRTLVVLADLGSALLLWRALRGVRGQALAVAAYLVAPVAFTLAGQHCNTDAMIGTCLLGSVVLAGGGRPVLAGALLGFSAWIKLPGLLAAPAIVLALPRRRDWLVCAGAMAAVAGVGLAPGYVAAAQLANHNPDMFPAGYNVMIERVFAYRGLYVHTAGTPATFIFGPKNFLFHVFGDDASHWPRLARAWLDLFGRPLVDRSRTVALALMVVLAVLRRRERSPIAIGATVALSYTVFYALVETWTFQYLAWGMALWLLLPWRAALVCHVVGGGFVYAVYAYVCGDPFLLATWDFAGHETWPVWLVVWRDAANLTFLGVGGWALVQAARTWRRRRRGRANAGPAPAADHLAS